MDTLKVYTPKQAAKVMQVDKRTVYAYLKAGQMPGKKIGHNWKILEEDLKAFLKDNEYNKEA